MAHRSYAARSHTNLAWITFGVSDELGNRASWNRWIHHYNVGLAADGRDRRDVPDEIEIEFVVEQRAGYGRCADKQERITIRGRFHDRLSADSGARAGPIFDDERLAKPLRQPFTDQACHDVICATRGSADDDAHRPRRIGLRPRKPRDGRERGSARGQMQKITAG